jgi:preprotein translocase subunit SecY
MNSELMRRAAITLGAPLVYRIGIQVPLPGIDIAVWEALFKPQAGGILGMVNIFGGAVAVVVTSLLYVALLIDPDQVAEKLRRYGSIVAGAEPGEAAADHLDKILSRTTLLGGASLAGGLVSEAVTVRAQVPFIFGGLSALIVVCTLLDLQAQVRGYNHITISRERQR